MASFKANINVASESSGNLMHDLLSFVQESNVLDTAVAIILGNAFKGVTDSFVTDILSPFITVLFGSTGTKLEDMFWVIGEHDVETLAEAEAGGYQIVRYGKFAQGLTQFILQCIVVFFIIRLWSRFKSLGSRLKMLR